MLSKIVIAFFTFLAFIAGLTGAGFEADSTQAQGTKNVIIMIGDGMGYNHLYATENKYGIDLEMLSGTEYHGYSKTRSASNRVTDSAAGGTALSVGKRTRNGCVGTYFLDQRGIIAEPASITEVAIKYNKSTGIVTSDTITGATPGAFSAHEKSRDMQEEIFADQLSSGIDLIWGGIDENIVSESLCLQEGFEYLTDSSDLKSLEWGTKSIGQFDADTLWSGTGKKNQPTLSELTSYAIDLLSQDEDGFFLMVEGAHIDKRSHNQDGDGAMAATFEFDKAVGEALDFAEADGNTLVIITADHETGGVTPVGDGTYTWESDNHTSADVPLLVYGADGFIEEGETVRNKDIPDRAVAYMTNNEQFFPCAVAYLNKD